MNRLAGRPRGRVSGTERAVRMITDAFSRCWCGLRLRLMGSPVEHKRTNHSDSTWLGGAHLNSPWLRRCPESRSSAYRSCSQSPRRGGGTPWCWLQTRGEKKKKSEFHFGPKALILIIIYGSFEEGLLLHNSSDLFFQNTKQWMGKKEKRTFLAATQLRTSLQP